LNDPNKHISSYDRHQMKKRLSSIDTDSYDSDSNSDSETDMPLQRRRHTKNSIAKRK